MKSIFSIAGIVCFLSVIHAQVLIDKPIQLTGSGNDARVTGIDAVSQPSDATSAEIVQNGSLNYASATGTADAISVTLLPSPPSYAAGMLVHLKTIGSNTGAVTVNVNGLGAKSVKKGVITDLEANDFLPGEMISLIYDGVNFQWIHGSGSSGGGGLPAGACISSLSATPPAGYSMGGSTQVFASGWSIKTTGPNPGGGFGYGRCMAVYNNKIYVFGGDTYGTNDQLHEYDPATDSWTQKANMLPGRGRGNFAAAAANGKLHVFGGQSPANVVDWVDEYNPITDSWTSKTSMNHARRYLAAASVNNKIYVIGGGDYSATSYVEEYNPLTDTWTDKTPMANVREYMTAVVMNNRIYTHGGSNGFGAVNEASYYDPATDSWTTLANTPVSAWFSGAGIGTKIYLASGNQTFEYDVATDTYLIKTPPLNNVSYFIPAGAVSGKMYLTDTNYTMAFDPTQDKTMYTHCPD